MYDVNAFADGSPIIKRCPLLHGPTAVDRRHVSFRCDVEIFPANRSARYAIDFVTSNDELVYTTVVDYVEEVTITAELHERHLTGFMNREVVT